MRKAAVTSLPMKEEHNVQLRAPQKNLKYVLVKMMKKKNQKNKKTAQNQLRA